MSLIKTYLHKQMSDFHETALLRYEQEQDQLAAEEREREQNPKYTWLVTQKDLKGKVFEDWCSTKEEAQEMVNKAVKEGAEVEWAKYAEGESPA
jgi:hypothetical protein